MREPSPTHFVQQFLGLINLDMSRSTQVEVFYWLLVMSHEAGKTGLLRVGLLYSLQHLLRPEAIHLLRGVGDRAEGGGRGAGPPVVTGC